MQTYDIWLFLIILIVPITLIPMITISSNKKRECEKNKENKRLFKLRERNEKISKMTQIEKLVFELDEKIKNLPDYSVISSRYVNQYPEEEYVSNLEHKLELQKLKYKIIREMALKK